MQARIRFCLSAAHTKEQLDYVSDLTETKLSEEESESLPLTYFMISEFQVLSHIESLADSAGLKYSRKMRDPAPIEYYTDEETE